MRRHGVHCRRSSLVGWRRHNVGRRRVLHWGFGESLRLVSNFSMMTSRGRVTTHSLVLANGGGLYDSLDNGLGGLSDMLGLSDSLLDSLRHSLCHGLNHSLCQCLYNRLLDSLSIARHLDSLNNGLAGEGLVLDLGDNVLDNLGHGVLNDFGLDDGDRPVHGLGVNDRWCLNSLSVDDGRCLDSLSVGDRRSVNSLGVNDRRRLDGDGVLDNLGLDDGNMILDCLGMNNRGCFDSVHNCDRVLDGLSDS